MMTNGCNRFYQIIFKILQEIEGFFCLEIYKNNQILGFYFNKKLETKTYRLSNYNKLFYTKSLENKNSYEFSK